MVERRGEFALFALFLRDDAPGTWDLVVSAEWLDPDRIKSLQFIYESIGRYLTTNELRKISMTVVLDAGGPVVRSFLDRVGGRVGFVSLENFWFNGVYIIKGYVISSKKITDSGRQFVRKERPTRAESPPMGPTAT
jgi:hypothetical protein